MASLSYDQRATRAGFGCLAVFMLPFLAAGVSVISVGIKEYSRNAGTQQWLVPIAAGSAFTIFALGFAAMPLYAIRRSHADAAALEQGVIVDRSGGTGVVLLIFALVWSAIAFPIGFFVWRGLPAAGAPAPVWVEGLALLFPLIGAWNVVPVATGW